MRYNKGGARRLVIKTDKNTEINEIDGMKFPVVKSLSTTKIKAHLAKRYMVTNNADVLMLVISKN
jgi:hypothetical protein